MAATQAWTRDTIQPADWTVPLPAAALAELRAVLAARQARAAADLPARSRRLRARCLPRDHGGGAPRHARRAMFAVLDRLPVAEMNRDEAIQLYWLLSSLLSRPVAQKLNGQMFFDVRDTGAKLKPGLGHPADRDQRRPALPQRQFLQRIAARLCLPALPASGQGGRRQPGDERRHGAPGACRSASPS